jgi:hypothetical protein
MIGVGVTIHGSRRFIGRYHKIGDMSTGIINGEARPGTMNACPMNKWKRIGTLGEETSIGNDTSLGEFRG